MLIAGGIFAFYFLPNPDLLFKSATEKFTESSLQSIELQDGSLLVQSNLVARVKRRPLGGVIKVDLQIPWPYDPTVPVPRPEDATRLENYLLVAIEPVDNNLISTERFKKIYIHYFDGPAKNDVTGLLHFLFRKDSPYADRELFGWSGCSTRRSISGVICGLRAWGRCCAKAVESCLPT